MRILMVFSLFLFVQSAAAITKCILNGKVIYKVGSCPKNSTTLFLIKNSYVTENELQKIRQERDRLSVKEFKRLSTPKRYDENGTLIKDGDQLESIKKTQKLNGALDMPRLQVEQKELGAIPVDTPKSNDATYEELQEMQRKLEQRNKELQLLQNL